MDFLSEIIDSTPNISVITEIEALSWVNPDKKKEAFIRAFIDDANVLYLTPAIVDRCIKIRKGKKIKTPDAIIVATAIVHNLMLLTSDKGFQGIQGMVIVNPNSL